MNKNIKPVNRKLRFFLKSLTVCLTISFLCLDIFLFVKFNKNPDYSTLSHIFHALSVILYFISIAECLSIAIRLNFMDLFTFCGNENYVFMHTGKLKAQKKLEFYTGIFLNIKNLKYINQRFGVKNGDIVIKTYSRIIDLYVRKHHGFVGRIGGDNYFLIIKNDEVKAFLDFLENVEIPLDFEGEQVNVPIKVRVGLEPLTNEEEIGNLCFNGIIAISQGRARLQDIVPFDKEMIKRFEGEKKIASDAKAGIRNHEFIPYYQPKVNIKTGRLCGCESLARWKRNGRLIPPGEFVPPLEKDGSITEIDFAIFEQVCSDIATWLSMGIEPVRISSNFSKYHLKDNEFVKHLAEIKDRYNVDGKYLEVELTESAGVSDSSLISIVSDQIRDLGISVSIDDFGTGYSSLSMLQEVNADVVKMDKSFLDNSFKDGRKQFIVDLINIVKHQNKEVLFEGVEEKEQVEFLRANGCDVIQGYFFDKPLTREQFEERLKNPYYQG